MSFEFLYANGKTKAITFSYDDGEIHDRRLVEIFNRYGMKATFHLNSGKFNLPGYITAEEVKDLYAGHEVSCHGVDHKYLRYLSKDLLIKEMLEDRRKLEELTGDIINGMSYAFGEFNDTVAETLEAIGFQYARAINSSHSFTVPEDFMRWRPTCHHKDNIIERADTFLHMPDYIKMPVFYIWGHSYEFHRENNWELMEQFCEKVAHKEDVWYTTNLEYRNYIMALKELIFNMESTCVFNPTGYSIWLLKDGKEIEIKPGSKVKL